MTTIRRVIEATEYPVTLAEAKLFCRVTSGTAEDSVITLMIAAATQECENKLQRAIVPQTWELVTDEFIDEISLPYPPIQSIASIAYIDANDAAQTVSLSDIYLSNQEPGLLTVAADFAWPATNGAGNAVVIRYVAGYQASPNLIPAPIKSWILLRIGTLYEHRAEFIIGKTIQALSFVDGLLDPYRIHTLV